MSTAYQKPQPTHNLLVASDLNAFERLCIPQELLSEAQLLRVTDAEARRDYGMRFDAVADLGGILFPYFSPVTGRRTTARVRRDNPEIVDGKIKNKYISGWGDPRHLYLPPGAAGKLKDDPDAPVVLVESEKAALALIAWARRTGVDIIPLGMGGCWGWHSPRAKSKEAPNGEREDVPGPISDLNYCNHRRVYVLLDNNTNNNPDVMQARSALVAELGQKKRGCSVLVCDLPVVDGVNGPDDYIGICGDEDMKAVFAAAHSPVAKAKVVEMPSPKPAAPAAPLLLTSELLLQCKTWIERFVILSHHQAIVCAVYLLHTYVWEIASKTPYLHIFSAEKAEGKTQLQATLAALAHNPVTGDDISAAALRRVPSQLKPTVFLDEMDAMLKGDKDTAEVIRKLLNSGFRAKGVALLCGGKDTGFKLERYPSFCPKVLAGIGHLPDTVEDRSIPIELHRMGPDQSVEDIDDEDMIEPQAVPWRAALERWKEWALPELKPIAVEKVPGLKPRQQNISKQLMQIVTLAGPEWIEALTEALQEIFKVSREDGSQSVTLLFDIGDIFAVREDPPHILSKELAGALCEIEGRPWAEWSHGKGLISGKVKKPPRVIARSTSRRLGSAIAQKPPFQPRDREDPRHHWTKPQFQNARSLPASRIEKWLKPAWILRSRGLAVQKGVFKRTMDVEVKIGGQYRMLTLAGRGKCRDCGKCISWGQDADGKFYPLNWKLSDFAQLHFDTCERRQKEQRRRERQHREPSHVIEVPAGIEMTQEMWRHLLRLVHPDKHHGGEDERLATEATRWLLEQKPYLKKKLYLKKAG